MQAKFVNILKQQLAIPPETFKQIITDVKAFKAAGGMGMAMDMGAGAGMG